VAEHWVLCSDDPAEHQRFADLNRALAAGGVPAAPANRHRHVRRLEVGGRVWFLKIFERRLWKNRLKQATTAPRASSDAERELRMTQALASAGFAVPTPVAAGDDGTRSVYVCRALPGRSVLECLRAGAISQGLAQRIARHCGILLAAGFHLPDLSAEHVFVDGAPGAERLAVLDLHNGSVAHPGPAPHRLLRRVLRHWLRSLRGVAVGFRPALRFAVRLLRTAGRPEAARSLLAGLPPLATQQRYEAPGKSHAYAHRNPRRDRVEQQLLARVWPGNRGESVLDLPCGAGRLLPLLRDRFGHRVLQADGALAMLRQARLQHASSATSSGTSSDTSGAVGDALAMPFAAEAVDGVVMFRFLHHLRPAQQRAAIDEACRVARRFVVVSFFHPCSLHHGQRLLQRTLGRPLGRHAILLGSLRRWFAERGYAEHQHAAQAPYLRDLWLASFVRNHAPGSR